MASKITNPVADLNDQFEQDWKLANDRYRAGINAGYSDSVAKELYLDPIRAKWKLIGSSPALAEDSKKIAQFSDEIDSAMRNDTVLPTLQKWSIEASLPQKTDKPLKASDLNAIRSLPAKVLKEAGEQNIIPVNPATQGLDAAGNPTRVGKPFQLTIPQNLSSDLQAKDTALLKSGVDPVSAERWARGLTLGTNWTIAPNVTTNAPAVPADNSHTILRWRNTPAIPADVSTNSFSIKPGGVDQEAVKEVGDKFAIQPPAQPAQEQFSVASPMGTSGYANPKDYVTKNGYRVLPTSRIELGGKVLVSPDAPVDKPAAPAYQSADDVKAAYRAGKISFDDSVKLLQGQFKMQ